VNKEPGQSDGLHLLDESFWFSRLEGSTANGQPINKSFVHYATVVSEKEELFNP